MQGLIDKGKSNETFLLFIETHSPNPTDYSDWRITVCFYSAMHYVKVFLKKNGISTNSHKSIEKEINTGSTSAGKFDKKHYDIYCDLHDNANLARYSGIYNPEATVLYMSALNKTAKVSLKQIKTYLKGRGLPIA